MWHSPGIHPPVPLDPPREDATPSSERQRVALAGAEAHDPFPTHRLHLHRLRPVLLLVYAFHTKPTFRSAAPGVDVARGGAQGHAVVPPAGDLGDAAFDPGQVDGIVPLLGALEQTPRLDTPEGAVDAIQLRGVPHLSRFQDFKIS